MSKDIPDLTTKIGRLSQPGGDDSIRLNEGGSAVEMPEDGPSDVTPIQGKKEQEFELSKDVPISDKIQPTVDLDELKAVISKKVDEYDPAEAAKEAGKSQWQGTTMGFCELVQKADPRSRCFFFLALFLSACVGLTQPMLFLILGKLIDNIGATSTSISAIESNADALDLISAQSLTPEDLAAQFAPSAEDENPLEMMKMIAMVQIYLAIGMGIFYIIAFYLYNQFAYDLARKTQINYFRACLHKDAAFYDEPGQVPTEMPSKIASESEAIKTGMGDKNHDVSQSIFMCLGGFAVGFSLGPELAGICMGFLPIFACGTLVVMGAYATGLVEIKKSYSQSAGYAEQALQAIRVVHTYGREALECKNYNKYLKRSFEAQQKFNVSMSVGLSIFMSLIFAFYGYSFIFGGMLRVREVVNSGAGGGIYTGGTIISVMNCIMIGSWSISGIFQNMQVLTEGRIAAKMAYEVIDKPVDVDSNAPGIECTTDTLKGRIEFKNVNFHYPTRQALKVMRDFSIVIEAGQTTALVGPSGSGKSTIIQLLERYYNPVSGEILVDGKPIADYQLKHFRRCIGYVGQEPVLFNTTVKQNMLYAKPDATDDEIIEALKMANAWSFVSQLDDGINSQVGAQGSMISGGQKQRIAIARAFVKKPRILLLDEATSALDKMNEQMVQEAIDRYRQEVGGVTIITIAHRLSTIRDADQILVIKDGMLTERGNHEALLKDYPQGIYAGFVEKQAASEEQQEESPAKVEDVKKKKSIKKTIVKDGETKEIMISPEEEENHAEADQADKKQEEEFAEVVQAATPNGVFNKLIGMAAPKYLLATGILGCFGVGGAQPIWAIFYSKAMTYMTMPMEFVPFAFASEMNEDETGKDFVTRMNNRTVWVAIVIGVCHGYGFWQRIGSFGVLTENLTLEVRKMLYEKMLRKNIGWFDDRSRATSVLTTCMQKDTQQINEAGTTSLQPIISAIACFITAVTVSFIFCWPMAAGALAIMPFQVYAMYYSFKTQHGFMGKLNEETKEMNLGLGDAIMNYKTVQSFGHEELLIQNFIQQMRSADEAAFWQHISKSVALGVCNFINMMINACMFLIAGTIVTSDRFDFGMQQVFTALFAMMFSGNQIGTSLGNGPDFGAADIAAKRVFDITDEPSPIDAVKMDEDKQGISPTDVKGKIEFVEVWFRYPARKQEWVLKGLSLVIEPNESVALVGESGCGKSTVVNLLMRFYDVDHGSILLDGIDIREYNLHEYRCALSMVMQEPIIFNYSILDNILYSKLDAKNSEIYEATELANCNEFIEQQYEREEHKLEDESPADLIHKLEENKDALVASIGQELYTKWLKTIKEMDAHEQKKGKFTYQEGDVDERDDPLRDKVLSKGFDTVTGYKGSKLSGGQKQRVAIARTIIRKPKVLLLDEATSALDEDSQKRVQLALENAAANRTTIVIAHRMSTIERCSKIFVLEYGTVKEEGNFKELKAAGGIFTKISEAKREGDDALAPKFQKTDLS